MRKLMNLKYYGNKPDVILPYDSEVEYLEATGTQWIDTGFCANGGCKVEYKAIQNIKNANGLLVGSHNPSNNTSNGYNRNQSGISSQNALKFNKCDKYEDIIVSNFDVNSFHTFSFDSREYNRIGYFDGNLVLNDTTSTILSPVNNIVLWRSQYNMSPSAQYYCVGGKISYLKIWDVNEVLVRDMIPVRFTNELGQSEGAMYDRVTGKLFRNQGTGSFLYGPDKS